MYKPSIQYIYAPPNRVYACVYVRKTRAFTPLESEVYQPLYRSRVYTVVIVVDMECIVKNEAVCLHHLYG